MERAETEEKNCEHSEAIIMRSIGIESCRIHIEHEIGMHLLSNEGDGNERAQTGVVVAVHKVVLKSHFNINLFWCR